MGIYGPSEIIAKSAKIAKIAKIGGMSGNMPRGFKRVQALPILAILAILVRPRWSARILTDQLRRDLAGAPHPAAARRRTLLAMN
jgi:hypothetical protein